MSLMRVRETLACLFFGLKISAWGSGVPFLRFYYFISFTPSPTLSHTLDPKAPAPKTRLTVMTLPSICPPFSPATGFPEEEGEARRQVSSRRGPQEQVDWDTLPIPLAIWGVPGAAVVPSLFCFSPLPVLLQTLLPSVQALSWHQPYQLAKHWYYRPSASPLPVSAGGHWGCRVVLSHPLCRCQHKIPATFVSRKGWGAHHVSSSMTELAYCSCSLNHPFVKCPKHWSIGFGLSSWLAVRNTFLCWHLHRNRAVLE